MKLLQQALANEALDLAHTALSADRPLDASLHAAQAVRLDPASIPARLLLAKIHIQLQHFAEAIASLDVVSQYDGAGEFILDTAVLRSIALAAGGRDEDALPLLSELTEQCPDDAHLHRLAAAACQRVGRIDGAIRHMERVVSLEPGDAAAARTLARLLAPNDPQAGIEYIQKDGATPSAASRWQTTQWMRQAGRNRDAEENYRTLLASFPEDAPLWIEAGEHAERIGSLDVAIKRFTLALQLPGPHQADTRAKLARSLMHAGRFEEAGWWWWKAARSDGKNEDAWAALTVCAHVANRPHLVDLCQRRLGALVDEDGAMFAMAQAWLEATTGDVIRIAMEPEQGAASTASPLTWILQQSADVLGEQARKNPGWADTLYHSAVCEAALGEHGTALDHVQAALDINPNYKAATTLAARLPKAA